MAFWFIFLLQAEPVVGPPAKQVCLSEAQALHQILSSSQCQWVPKQQVPTLPEECEWPLQCKIQDSTNTKFQFCPNGLETHDQAWSKAFADNLFQLETQQCQADSTHLKRCRYVPEQRDGIAVGDDPGFSDENCKVPLRRESTSGQR